MLILLFNVAGYFALRFGKPKYMPLQVGPAKEGADAQEPLSPKT